MGSAFGPFSVNLTNVGSGTHVYTAKATDSAGAVAVSAPITITANAFPTVGILTPANGQTFSAPAAFTFTAAANDGDGSISRVEYFEGINSLGTGTGASYSRSISGVAAGSHSYTAHVTDSSGNVTVSEAIGIVVTAFSPTATPPAPASNYPTGRLTVVKDKAGTAVHYYDKVGNVIQSDRQLTPLATANWYSIKSDYDALGRVKQLTYPDSSTLAYTYDSYGNLQTVGSYATFTPGGSPDGYTAAGQVGQVSFGNGLITKHTYYPEAQRLHTLTTGTVASGSAIQDLQYAYYSSGSIYVISDHTGSPIQTFTYDALDRLHTADGPYGALTFDYDAIGNMTSNSGLGTYSYTGSCGGGAHAVKLVTHAGGGTDTYCYDPNGNMTSAPGRSIDSYDIENHPTSITAGGVTTQLQYDANGMRVKKTVGTNPATVYVGKLYECAAGSCTTYILAGDQRIAAVTGALTFYYHGDHLGSSSVVSDGSGNVVQTLGYKPYGSAYLNSGSVDVHHKYTGQELDDSTGLYYYQARYYDAVLGRFVGADTLVPEPANPQAFNRYAYASNSPTNRVDPTGHDDFFVPGTDISGKRDSSWWHSGSNFSIAVKDLTIANFPQDPSTYQQISIDWSGGNSDIERIKAAAQLAYKTNQTPVGIPVTWWEHSHGGNVGAIASQWLIRDVNLVVTEGTPVISDYQYDMSHIKQGIAISSPNDWVQPFGGNSLNLPFIGEVGLAGRDRTQEGWTNYSSPAYTGHSYYYNKPQLTTGIVFDGLQDPNELPSPF